MIFSNPESVTLERQMCQRNEKFKQVCVIPKHISDIVVHNLRICAGTLKLQDWTLQDWTQMHGVARMTDWTLSDWFGRGGHCRTGH